MNFLYIIVFFCSNIFTTNLRKVEAALVNPDRHKTCKNNHREGPFMKTSSINRKLFIIILVFVCLPISIIGLIWYETSTRTIEQEAIQSNQKLIRQTNEYLDLYISNLENMTYPFVNNPQIQHFINSKSLNNYDFFILAENIEKDLFSQMIYGRQDIVGISLVGKNNIQINDYTGVKELINMEEIRKRNIDLLQTTDKLDNFNIIGLHQVGSMPVLTITRKIHSNISYLYEGLLIIDINLNQISKISKNLLTDKSKVYILDKKGQIIYHSDKKSLGSSFSKDIMNKYLNKTSNAILTDINKVKKYIIYEHSHVTNWILVAEIPRDQIIGNLIRLRTETILLGILILIVAMAVVGGFSLTITKSLSYMQRLMRKVESGDLNIEISSIQDRKDEIGGVFKSFFKMVRELRRLYEEIQISKMREHELELKQKESTLQAMQSQINPHFLYNTLEIINSHAIVENNPLISKIATSLAHMFRYNLGNAKQVVTLEEEISHIRSYLEIQCARFRHLHVDIQIDEKELARIGTIRLTLQPLIENAFLHGYQNHKMKPSYIGIHGEKKLSYFVLRIQDKGKGMDPATMEDYNKAFENKELIPVSAQENSIGLWNVHQRIRLVFGYPYGLLIKQSSTESGTLIELKLPYIEEEKQCIV